jgi:hypothetical protein
LILDAAAANDARWRFFSHRAQYNNLASFRLRADEQKYNSSLSLCLVALNSFMQQFFNLLRANEIGLVCLGQIVAAGALFSLSLSLMLT